jgi:methenyltetrahydromethanopterin cyclohydrolase
MLLNARAWELCDRIETDAEALGVRVERSSIGTRLIDCGINASGGLAAGLRQAEVCLSGLGNVTLVPGAESVFPGPAVAVATDQPVAACMASQYAGWQITGGKYFAMGSGPMRAAAKKEALFEHIGHRESPQVAVGVLETRSFPPEDLQRELARQCGVEPDKLTLLAAPTASLAGSLQVVARSVETALHKIHELGFELARIKSGWGVAPLPPVAKDDLAAIGRTNDSILYGGEVTLWVDASDAELAELGPKVPSSASADHGQPFAQIFARYNHDFYQIDPHLFSPAVVTFISLSTGRVHRFGHLSPQVLRQSFLE